MWQVLQGDARRIPLGDEVVQCVVTSPPYWGLRDFGISERALGLEPTPDLYIEQMVEIFREIRRVLRKDGTVWMNLGDSYCHDRLSSKMDGDYSGDDSLYQRRADYIGGKMPKRVGNGLKVKDLMGIPWRVALALQADGWWLRSDIIWAKPNPMPESCTDRPTRSHEYVFLLTKSANYYYDADAVREPQTRPEDSGKPTGAGRKGRITGMNDDWVTYGTPTRQYNPAGRNLRSVWHIPTQPFPEAHFATFAEALVMPCIKAGTSEKGACAECGSPWERVVEKGPLTAMTSTDAKRTRKPQVRGSVDRPPLDSSRSDDPLPRHYKPITTLGWKPTCKHDSEPVPCLVLDCFSGSGTVGVVCLKLGRSFVGIEIKPDYSLMAMKRIHNSGSLFG